MHAEAIGLKEANKDKQHFTVFQGLIEIRNAHGKHAY